MRYCFVLKKAIFILILTLYTINQASAKLGALGVLEVLRQDFEAVKVNNYQAQQKIAEAAVTLIITTCLPIPFQRDYRVLNNLKNTTDFPTLNDDFNGHFSTLLATDLHGISYGQYRYFGFASKVATASQRAGYAAWFLKAAKAGVKVDEILESTAYLLENPSARPFCTPPAPPQAQSHLTACKQLWQTTPKDVYTEHKRAAQQHVQALETLATAYGAVATAHLTVVEKIDQHSATLARARESQRAANQATLEATRKQKEYEEQQEKAELAERENKKRQQEWQAAKAESERLNRELEELKRQYAEKQKMSTS